MASSLGSTYFKIIKADVSNLRPRDIALGSAGLPLAVGIGVTVVHHEQHVHHQKSILRKYDRMTASCIALGARGCGGKIYESCMEDKFWGGDPDIPTNLCQAPARLGSP